MPEGKARKPGPYLFAGVPWRTPADSVVATLAGRGYTETPGSRQKDRLYFEGRLFDHWATVHAMLDDRGRLVRWEITIPISSGYDRDEYAIQRRLYDDAVTEMEAKYGPRRSTLDRFKFPYEKGDGREATAVREGYATVRSEWTGRGGDRLEIELDRAVAVVVTYESPWWTATENERRKRKAKDL